MENRIQIFTQIHEIVFYGKGGYSWMDVYNMPVWLRNFTFHKLQEVYKSDDSDSVSTLSDLQKNYTEKEIKVPDFMFKKK